jgi:hypothetical protein
MPTTFAVIARSVSDEAIQRLAILWIAFLDCFAFARNEECKNALFHEK